MIKRKPFPTQQATSRPSPAAKPPPPVEDYDDDELAAEVEAEEVAPSKPATAKSAPKRSNEEDSLANAFDSVPAGSNADNIPPGKYEAIVSGAVFQDWDPKGRSIRMKFELCATEFENQNQLTTWFKIYDKDRQIQQVGTSIFKQTMAKLGYEVKFKDIEETLAAISEEQPGVLITVGYNKTETATYQRITIDGPCNNDVIQEYKDNVAY